MISDHNMNVFPLPCFKDFITEETNNPQVLPTLVTLEASSQEQRDEELSSEDNSNAKKEDEDVTKKRDRGTAVLMSEEELVDLLKKEAQDEEEAEERELEDEEKAGKALRISKEDETEGEEKQLGDSLEAEKEIKDEEEARDDSVEDKVEQEIEKMPFEEKEEEPHGPTGDREETSFLEETESSTASEILPDLDYAADSGILQPLQMVSSKVNPPSEDTQSISQKEESDLKKETSEKEPLDTADYYQQDMQATEAEHSQEEPAQMRDKSTEIGFNKKEPEIEEAKRNGGLDSRSRLSRKDEEENKNDSGINSKGKTKKLKKNQRQRKHSPQRDERHPAQEQSQDAEESEDGSIENTVQKAKRRRAGKWVI